MTAQDALVWIVIFAVSGIVAHFIYDVWLWALMTMIAVKIFEIVDRLDNPPS